MRMVREERGDVTVARLSGVIGWDDTDALKQLAAELVEAGRPSLVLEVSGISRVSSAFIGWMFAAVDEAETGGGPILVSPSAAMAEILEITGLEKSVRVCETVDEAVDSCG